MRWKLVFTIVYALSSHLLMGQETVTSTINAVKDEFAPDKRVVIFDILAKPGNPVILAGETNLPEAKSVLLQNLEAKDINYRDEIEVLTAKPALVNISVCNIRSVPKHSGELATQSILGTPLKVWKQQENWYLIQTPDHYLGWVDGGGITVMDEADMQQWQSSERIVITAHGTFVRDPVSEQIVTDLVQGAIMMSQGVEGNKQMVELPDGRNGYVPLDASRSFADFFQEPADPVEGIIGAAYTFMGRPYLWGGTSERAMDCSGFTKTIFYLNGLMLPRDASQQVHVGQAIDTDKELRNLERGDLLFFGRKKAPGIKERITHVAVYLGEGRILHASGRVKIESLDPKDPAFAPDRLATLVRAKRMTSMEAAESVVRMLDHPWYQ